MNIYECNIKKNWKNEMKRFVPQSLLDPSVDIQLMIRSEIMIKAINDIFCKLPCTGLL